MHDWAQQLDRVVVLISVSRTDFEVALALISNSRASSFKNAFKGLNLKASSKYKERMREGKNTVACYFNAKRCLHVTFVKCPQSSFCSFSYKAPMKVIWCKVPKSDHDVASAIINTDL